MSRFIKEVAELLDGAGIGVYSTNDPAARTIYTGSLPETLKEGILMIESASPAPEVYIDTMYPIIDFWARSDSSDRAYDLLYKVYSFLDRRYGYSTANYTVYNSNVLGSIVDADRDAESGKLYRLSVQFIIRDLKVVS